MAATLRNDERFDVILIGSGMGALATASILAQLQNKRVLIAEQHFKVGGFTHTFQRKGSYEWDVGVHYVGKMEKGGVFRALMDYVTGGAVDWHPMPDVYDRIVFPEHTFGIRSGRKNLKADLLDAFPDESRAIEAYFRDVDKSDAWAGRYLVTQLFPELLRPLTRLIRRMGARLALETTTRDYLNALTPNERLKALLAAQWGLHGLPLSIAPFGVHAMLVRHYFGGGWYPVGGSGTIAASVVPIIRRHGGEVLVNHRADEILVANGRATGVRIVQRRGKEETCRTVYADAIVSGAGAHVTYCKLLPEGVHLPFAEALRRFPEGCTTVTVYLGLKRDPAELGLKGENYWIYAGEDHEALYARRDRLLEGEPSGAYLTGSDAGVFGVVGAMMSGAMTAAVIMGRPWSMFQVFSRAMRFSKAIHRENDELS